ncbi:hypothetical protein T01_3917 [Trichinella spiralis]|uniref:Uncharacterized protein n=1 Tax=Trichinella spiralis TaxID=6334 RepID=A0A0V1BYZ6_TRISP|nr:hypothetical protein T01_3917 [Trichinella spiralis]
MAQECHLPLHEPAFLCLHIQAHIPEMKHPAQSGRMLFGRTAEYDDVVEVYQALGPYQDSQDRLLESLKGGRRVEQSKRHHFELVQAIRGGEGRLLSVLFLPLHLPVAACQDQGSKTTA